jgi:hypothetical protein
MAAEKLWPLATHAIPDSLKICTEGLDPGVRQPNETPSHQSVSGHTKYLRVVPSGAGA